MNSGLTPGPRSKELNHRNEVAPCRLTSYSSLVVVADSSRQNDDSALHSKIIVKRADVRVNARVRKRDAKTCEAQWSLRQQSLILRRRDDETGVHIVGSRIDSRVQCAGR